jgi:SAM-dependent methyltransferase
MNMPHDRPHDDQAEQERIRTVYRQWGGAPATARYAWHRPEILQQLAARARIMAPLLAEALGTDLSTARILDVGCGTGAFLRQLIAWGADPSRLTGTEFQQDRLDLARRQTAEGVQWHLGGLDCAATGSIDLASAETVFSSILDPGLRRALAAEMWRTVKPGGWCMVFDFRYDNPRNPNVRKVTLAELREYWPAAQCHYRTLLLAPPIARRLARAPWLATELLTALLPVLRSHFIFMARKDS